MLRKIKYRIRAQTLNGKALNKTVTTNDIGKVIQLLGKYGYIVQNFYEV